MLGSEIMRREMYDDLLKWKSNPQKKPLIIYGPRQVGKTYLINEFGKNNYENIFYINFEIDVNAKNIFAGNLDIKTLVFNLSVYNSNIPIIENKTLIFLDEVQKCPQVFTALKSFALDSHYDIIVSGSMMGIVMHDVSSFPVGYVERLYLRPMSFKEFLWANNYTDEMIDSFKEYYINEKPLPTLIHNKLNELFLHYIVVGGMPEVVKKYIYTYNLYFVLETQKRILSDYKDDIVKYSSKTMKEKIRECFESIPDQLAKDNKKFQFKVVKQGGNSRYYANSLSWILDADIGIKVNKLKSIDIPLKAYRDPNAFKFYFFDTGLLLAFYNENLSNEIINGNLGVFKGGIFENVIAQVLTNNELDLYYYQKSDNLEIDFITYLNNKIIPIEVKSSKNTKAISIKNLIEKENLDYAIILSTNNLNCDNPKLKFLPLYMSMFLNNNH